jgi:hypothetical protein
MMVTRITPSEEKFPSCIGIEQFRTRRDFWLDWMLIQPLRGRACGYALDPKSGRKGSAE